MQGYAVKMRDDLWSSLKKVYDGVSNGRDDINTVQVEYVVKNVMKETDQMELDYIFKNLFRLDLDGNGGISFNEFVNFLLLRPTSSSRGTAEKSPYKEPTRRILLAKGLRENSISQSS